ncbi:kielin/chordin-like protein isoform X2 [Haliotis rufescens]|uniref:kielin/chordin-like protein isoform X2 n=1 Tax=Haliotis rufescens TaxID=6454 RepID=UPI00201EA8C1|nr:kielin/chordin-like protein isoform X2 [Haliotis rufescens]
MGHLTLSSTTMLSHGVLVVVIFLSFSAQHTEGQATEETTTTKELEDVKCPHLPCPLPGNCIHKVWSHFWYHGKLCKGCQFCVNGTSAKTFDSLDEDVKCPRLPCPPPPRTNCSRTAWSFFWYHGKFCKGCQYCVIVHGSDHTDTLPQDVKCPHLPCPLPANCTRKAWSFFWYHGMFCKGCQNCIPEDTETGLTDSAAKTSPSCPHLPCPPPFPNCARFEWTHFTYEGKVCRGCQMCVYWNISRPAARQVHLECPVFKCPAPGPCDTPYSIHEVTIPGVSHKCPGCPYCPSESSPVKRLLASCPDVSCAEPGPCDVPLKMSTLDIDGHGCPGCAYCPQ